MMVIREADPPIITDPSVPPVRARRPYTRAVALSLGYLVIFLGMYYISSLFELNHGISPWFLPQGLSLALLVTGGLVYTPVVALANLLAGLCVAPLATHTPPSVLVTCVMAVVVTGGYGGAAYLLRHTLRLNPYLSRLRDVINFALAAAVIPLGVGACVAVVLVLFHEMGWGEFTGVVITWWNGSMIGLLTVAPAGLVYGALLARTETAIAGQSIAEMAGEQPEGWRFSWGGLVQALVWAGAIVMVLWLVAFLQIHGESGESSLHLSYLTILLIVWMALQYGIRGTTAGVLGISLGMTIVMRYFLHLVSPDNLVESQILIITLSVTGLLLGAVVSERRQTEEAVRSSEDLLRTLIDAMPDLVTFKDGAGRWLAANEYGLRLFQLDCAAYCGKTDTELAELQPAYLDAFLARAHADAHCWEVGHATHTEEVILHPDGTETIFDVITVPLYHASGERKGLVVIGRDITERKQAEEALDRERAFLSSAIDILPLPLAFLSTNGEWTLTNAACDSFAPGFQPRQWLEAPMLSPENRTLIPRDERPITRSLENQELISTEVILALPGGREVPLLVHSGPIYVNGVMVSVVAAFQDISALKAADQAKDEFLGILSHELIAPLNDTLGWTQAAREMPETAPQALEIIEHNARLLHRVMTDLLDLSRIVHGRLLLNCKSLDLGKLAEKCASDFEPMCTGRRRTLKLEPSDETLPVSVDTDRLQQAINTLLTNALKGTDAGDAIIISCLREGNRGVLVIRDTGRGIAAETLPHLFTPFHQSQTADQGRTMGLGLGMAITKGIVEAHGGTITADSPGAGLGSIFTLDFPLGRDADEE